MVYLLAGEVTAGGNRVCVPGEGKPTTLFAFYLHSPWQQISHSASLRQREVFPLWSVAVFSLFFLFAIASSSFFFKCIREFSLLLISLGRAANFSLFKNLKRCLFLPSLPPQTHTHFGGSCHQKSRFRTTFRPETHQFSVFIGWQALLLL